MEVHPGCGGGRTGSRRHLQEPDGVRLSMALQITAKCLSVPETNLRRWVSQKSVFVARMKTAVAI
jgi:hypothetical protein